MRGGITTVTKWVLMNKATQQQRATFCPLQSVQRRNIHYVTKRICHDSTEWGCAILFTSFHGKMALFGPHKHDKLCFKFPVTKRTVSEPFIRNEKFTPKVFVGSNGRMTFVAWLCWCPKSSCHCDGGHKNTPARHSLQFSQKYSPISERDDFPDLALR